MASSTPVCRPSLLAACINLALAMRYEERDLLHRFGRRYADWRGVS
jgi:protein-S-isoprenylcysteine O-methyltransferase Ste14